MSSKVYREGYYFKDMVGVRMIGIEGVEHLGGCFLAREAQSLVIDIKYT